MKLVVRFVLTLVVFLAFAAAGEARNTAYYIDCAHGDDSADGLAPATAWHSLAKVSGRTFEPGDSIRLRRNTSCAGMLWPKGSGEPGAPIALTAWGEGPLPKIQSGPENEAALKLFDQQHWRVENLELSGGQPYGVLVSGRSGVLRGIHLANLVVHDVTGIPKTKDAGLVVVRHGGKDQRFDDVLIDGITAYRTSQWAGILVGGTSFGFIPETARSTNVVVRNCTVHDVQGDGIVLFEVNTGRIENSVAWHTGMQETETIGTPNGIWTWMCRDCTVADNEAFLTDSPGIDGGAFDIDYGNDNNVVAGNYGHDTQGYCVAVFGAGWVTTNSVVRNNVCAGNGRSPRLARRQGAIFLSTWDKGKLRGVEISDNRVLWNPPIEAAALVSNAVFEGRGTFTGNTIRSTSRLVVSTNDFLGLDSNRYEHSGGPELRWRYGAKEYVGLKAYQAGSGQDAHATEVLSPSYARDADGAPHPAAPMHLEDAAGRGVSLDRYAGRWLLAAFVPAPEANDAAGRGQVTLLRSAARQFRSAGMKALVVAGKPAGAETAANLKYDWHLGSADLLFSGDAAKGRAPSTLLLDPAGRVVWRHEGLTPPGELGLALRSLVGEPDYARMEEE